MTGTGRVNVLVEVSKRYTASSLKYCGRPSWDLLSDSGFDSVLKFNLSKYLFIHSNTSFLPSSAAQCNSGKQ